MDVGRGGFMIQEGNHCSLDRFGSTMVVTRFPFVDDDVRRCAVCVSVFDLGRLSFHLYVCREFFGPFKKYLPCRCRCGGGCRKPGAQRSSLSSMYAWVIEKRRLYVLLARRRHVHIWRRISSTPNATGLRGPSVRAAQYCTVLYCATLGD